MKKNSLFVLLYLSSCFAIKAANIDSLISLVTTPQKKDSNYVKNLNNIAKYYVAKGKDSCLLYAQKALVVSKSINYTIGNINALIAIGSHYNGTGDFKLALACNIEAYKLAEKINATKAMSNIMNSMGNTYLGIKNNDKALESYLKSYEIALADSNKHMIAVASIGIGNIYANKNNHTEAIIHFTKAQQLFQTKNDIYPLSVAYVLIGNSLVQLEQYEQAFQNFDKALKQIEKTHDSYGIAGTYETIGNAYTKKEEYVLALEWFFKALNIFKERKAYMDLMRINGNIANAYRDLKDFENAFGYYTQYSNYKDSVYNSENNKQLVEIETKYETEKKQQEIELQKSKLNESKLQRTILIIVVVVSIVILLLVFTRYRAKRKANRTLSTVNAHLKVKNQIIEQKNLEITDSIRYAQRIQNAILPPLTQFKKEFPNSFILFKPKDIVSGDFYWMEKADNQLFFAVADCTGHGVPGALVSVICRNALNMAVKEFGITEPGLILDKVREIVIETFDQYLSSNEKDYIQVQDGMDISLCSLNVSSKELKWAGANNPLWILRKETTNIEQIKGDKQPVGKHINSFPFKTHAIQFEQEDTIYLFSDGFADQFGGPNGKKFKYKQLEDTLIKTANESMEIQQQLLNQTFENWKNDLEQVDDVCVIGIKLV